MKKCPYELLDYYSIIKIITYINEKIYLCLDASNKSFWHTEKSGGTHKY